MPILPTVAAGSMHGAVVPIAYAANNGSSQTITFTNIPQIYQDLLLVTSIRSSTSATTDSILVQFNSTTSIYSDTDLYGNGSSASSSRGSNTYGMFAGYCAANTATSSIFGSHQTHILDYANTSAYKTTINRASADLNGSGYSVLTAGLARTTSAITTVTVFPASANMIIGSTATLYGVRTVNQ